MNTNSMPLHHLLLLRFCCLMRGRGSARGGVAGGHIRSSEVVKNSDSNSSSNNNNNKHCSLGGCDCDCGGEITAQHSTHDNDDHDADTNDKRSEKRGKKYFESTIHSYLVTGAVQYRLLYDWSVTVSRLHNPFVSYSFGSDFWGGSRKVEIRN
mmetsp:Transcript_54158/g.58733  ORF Transcript_54158/g.58733 Transcript_54158/m.58733 type:complete len:153 (-) Transcript_54158:561-1019(-)